MLQLGNTGPVLYWSPQVACKTQHAQILTSQLTSREAEVSQSDCRPPTHPLSIDLNLDLNLDLKTDHKREISP